ncbi:uncharacterized protein LOC135695499 [Rhopilema esculentum]|uniref:uncharacterized protein LOC135695499 n=1 Tax=Rhopilema esculentum TaxID=499914 RepID=UPI0031D3BE88
MTVLILGTIEASLNGKLSLEFAMAGTWRNPFKFEYLALANLNLAIGISVGGGGVLPTFQFGGTVWVGVIEAGSNDHAIKISIYFGIDFNNPDDNYIFGSVNKFTLSQIFKAFKLGKPKVPRVVAESGFPEGLTVSYSMEGETIEALDLNIQKGLYLKGTLNFLGFKVCAEILISPPEKLLIDVALSPISWAGGLITLQRNETDGVNGPKAFIYLKPDSVTVQIEGYISLLGISKYVYIDVSDTGFKFQMTTDIWGMIRSDLVVQAAYGNLAALHFSFVANVKIDFHLRQIADAAIKYLDKAKDIAVKKLEEAQRRVADAQKKVENAEKKMDGWKKSIDDYQNRLRKRAAEIEEAKKEFAKSCKSECGDVCIPFLDWKSECFKIWWWWVGCPTWNNCKWKAPNVICIAACEIKKAAKKFVAWAEQTGIKILIGLSEVGKGLIDVGKGFVTMAKHLVGFAIDILKFVQDVVKVGIEISKNIMNWVGDNLFKVELLELRGKLTSDFNACVGITCKFVIFGLKADYTGDLCVNLKFWENLAADTVEEKYKGTKKMIQKVPNIDGKAREFENNKNDLGKKEEDIEKDVKKETKDRRKRDYVPTAEEMYYRRLAEEPLPAIVTRSASTVNAFKNGAPWVLVEGFDKSNFDHTPLEDSNIPAEKRTLHEDWHKHHAKPCLQISKVIDKYSMIADGLRSLHDSMINVREGYQATKRTMQQGVDDLRREITSTEMKHNMTHEEQEDLYHWYNKAKDGTKKWNYKARHLMADEHSLMLPRFRSQIEHILKKEKDQNFLGYMNELHEVGQAAFKRSNIPSESTVTAAKELRRIKKDLIDLVHSDESNQPRFGAKVRSIQTNIRGLKRSMERCN